MSNTCFPYFKFNHLDLRLRLARSLHPIMLSEDKKKRGGNLVGQEMKKEMNMSRETLPELLITVTRFHNISMTKKRSIHLGEKCFDREKECK